MDLIERYLNQIGRRLPQGKRDDIRDELRSALDDALENRAIGEPSEEDVVAVLTEFGPPGAVAASYSGDRYLIGPELYPRFLTTLKIVVTILAALVTVGFAISTFAAAPGGAFAERLIDLVSGLLDSVITSLGIVVIVFALLERVGVKTDFPEKTWDPRDLPAVRDTDVAGRFDSIAGIVFPAIALILINQFQDRIGVVVNPGGELLLNDVFRDNLPWINASLLLPMGLSVWLFWSGSWRWSTRLLKIAFDIFSLYVVYRICQGLIAASSQLLDAGISAGLVGLLARGATLAPMVVAAVVLFDAGKQLYRVYKNSS